MKKIKVSVPMLLAIHKWADWQYRIKDVILDHENDLEQQRRRTIAIAKLRR